MKTLCLILFSASFLSAQTGTTGAGTSAINCQKGCTETVGNTIQIPCDGVTDMASALNGLVASNRTLLLNGVCPFLTGTGLSISGISNLTIAGAGPNSGITFSQAAAIDNGIGFNASSNVKISGLSITGQNSATQGVGRLIFISLGSSNMIDNCVLTFGGTVTPSSGARGGIVIENSPGSTVKNSTFSSNGPISGSPSGFDVVGNFSNGSSGDRYQITNNTVSGSNTSISVGIYSTNQSSISGNSIDQNNAYSGTNSDGYGILLYASGSVSVTSCTRTTNVVTCVTGTNTFGTGSHIILAGTTAAGSTTFNGDFVLTSATSTSIVFPQVAPNDTSTGGSTNFAYSRNVVTNNHVNNTSGSGVYFASNIDGVISNNTISQFGQQQSDASLPVAGIALNGSFRTAVVSNTIWNSVKDGVSLVGSLSGTITANAIALVRYGVKNATSNYTTISDNSVSGATIGVNSTTAGQYLIVHHNTITNVTNDGISLTANYDFSSVDGNTVQGGGNNVGIAVNGGHNSVIDGNKVTCQYQGAQQASDGILEVLTSSVISNNNTQGCTIGLLEEGTSNLTVGNVATGNSNFGIYLGNATTPFVGANTATGNATNTFGAPVNTTGLAPIVDIFAHLGRYLNGSTIVCTDCDAPVTQGAACTSAGAKAGAQVIIARSTAQCY